AGCLSGTTFNGMSPGLMIDRKSPRAALCCRRALQLLDGLPPHDLRRMLGSVFNPKRTGNDEMSGPDNEQAYISRINGLAFALEKVCFRLKELHPDMPVGEIEALRDDLIQKLKNSDIPAESEMLHVEIVRPAIETIEAAFAGIIRDW
ncbi:hypothetical protein ACWGS9_34225, partial [Bradyrhizobium sp. Arg314]